MSKESGGNWFRGPFSLAGPGRRSDRLEAFLFRSLKRRFRHIIKDEGARAALRLYDVRMRKVNQGAGLCMNGVQSHSP